MESVGNHSGAIRIPSPEELKARLAWLSIGPEDEDLLKSVDAIIDAHLEELMDHLYSHFLSSEETASFFHLPEVLNRARSQQHKYFSRLTKGNYDSEYVKERWQIGSTHHRIDLAPKWYLGAYCRALTFMQDLLLDILDKETYRNVLPALTKIIFFDMSLAIDTYIISKEHAIRQHRDAIRELETERKVTKSILESAPLGIVRLDSDLLCLESNREFLEMAHVETREDLVGRPLSELAPYLELHHFLAAIKEGRTYRGQAEQLRFSVDSQQASLFFDWAVWPVKDQHGTTEGAVAMFVNSTDRVKLQQQREDFVATLTHDLKTPILAANRALMLLMDGDFGKVTDDQKKILETIHQSNDALYQLVLTLLDVYRYDSGVKQLSVGPYDLSEIAERIANELMPLATSKKISLNFERPNRSELVRVDPDEIRRVIQNLIDNSLKFTARGGSIVVAVGHDKDSAIVSITDTGKGISDDDKPKLFQRFWQSASGGRYYASTGLGLYLCRKIVEIHGGKIWCVSELGKGSKFCFSLPKMDLE